jgi:hypothetical protein
MDSDFVRILEALRAAEWRAEQEARAGTNGADLQSHVAARLPPGYGADRLAPLR